MAWALTCCCVKGECDAALGADFVFSVRSKELIIGEVYVRIYNEQPTFPLEVCFHLILITLLWNVGLMWCLGAVEWTQSISWLYGIESTLFRGYV